MGEGIISFIVEEVVAEPCSRGVVWVCRQLDMPRAKEVRDDVAYRLRAEAKEEEANSPMAAFDQFSGVQVSERDRQGRLCEVDSGGVRRVCRGAVAGVGGQAAVET